MSGIDLNRAGIPLLEIVSAPDLRSAKEAVAYLKTLHSLVRYLNVSDANMQEGSFRCDANVSMRPLGEEKLGTRTEMKNLNSFRFVERAINYEVDRQIKILEKGEKIIQETRLYDADRNETRAMRSKEEAQDYRYFPDPDLMPLKIAGDAIEKIRNSLPELPQQKYLRLQKQYQLSKYDANVLISSQEMAEYFEKLVKNTKATAKIAANWVLGELSATLNKENLNINQSKISEKQLAKLLDLISANIISGKIAKNVFELMWSGEGEAEDIVEKKGLKQVNDTAAIDVIIDQIIAANPNQVEQYRQGKDKLFGFFVGQTMKETKGKANPQQVNQLLKTKLS